MLATQSYRVVLAVKDEDGDALAASRRSSILDRCAHRDCPEAGNPAQDASGESNDSIRRLNEHHPGVMQEALMAALSWGFQVMELNRIEAQLHPNNQRSIGLLGLLGFLEEGRLRQAAYWATQYHDMVQYSLLRVEWKGNNGTP